MPRVSVASTDWHNDQPADKRTMTVLGVVAVGFFWVAGGAYGNEELIQSGPPAIVLWGVIGAALFFALPTVFICAELCTTYPENGGIIVPVRYALGPTYANHMAYWVWIVNLLDSTVYPLLASQYLGLYFGGIDNSYEEKFFFSYPIITLVAVVNFLGLDWMVRFSAVIFCLTLGPPMTYVFWGFFTGNVYFKGFTITSGDSDYSLLVSWVIWLYSGFLSLGILAGEVKNPRKTFLYAVMILVPITLFLNLSPILVSLSVDSDYSDYYAGYFQILAKRLAGKWLKYCFMVGSISCYLGLHNAQSVTSQEGLAFLIETSIEQQIHQIDQSLWRFFKPIFPILIPHKLHLMNNQANQSLEKTNTKGAQTHLRTPSRDLMEGQDTNNAKSSAKSTAKSNHEKLDIVKLSNAEDNSVESGSRPLSARRVYVVFNFLCVIFGTSWLSYSTIIQAEMLTNNVAMFLLFYAYAYLKIYNDGRERPFVVPGGYFGAAIAILLPIIVILLYSYVSVSESYGRFIRLLLFFGIQGFGFFVHVTWSLVSRWLFANSKNNTGADYSTFNSVKKVKWGQFGSPKVVIDDQEQSVSKANMESLDPVPTDENPNTKLLSNVHGSSGL